MRELSKTRSTRFNQRVGNIYNDRILLKIRDEAEWGNTKTTFHVETLLHNLYASVIANLDVNKLNRCKNEFLQELERLALKDGFVFDVSDNGVITFDWGYSLGYQEADDEDRTSVMG